MEETPRWARGAIPQARNNCYCRRDVRCRDRDSAGHRDSRPIRRQRRQGVGNVFPRQRRKEPDGNTARLFRATPCVRWFARRLGAVRCSEECSAASLVCSSCFEIPHFFPCRVRAIFRKNLENMASTKIPLFRCQKAGIFCRAAMTGKPPHEECGGFQVAHWQRLLRSPCG